MEPMNVGVMVVGVVLIALSMFLVVRDQRKRERNKKLAAPGAAGPLACQNRVAQGG